MQRLKITFTVFRDGNPLRGVVDGVYEFQTPLEVARFMVVLGVANHVDLVRDFPHDVLCSNYPFELPAHFSGFRDGDILMVEDIEELPQPSTTAGG